jgi:hypothetical protein
MMEDLNRSSWPTPRTANGSHEFVDSVDSSAARSRATAYGPAPGTVAYRALAHLQALPRGAEVMTSVLAEALNTDGYRLTPCLEAPLKHGLLFRRQRDTHPRSPFWWSLTDHGGSAHGGGDAAGLEDPARKMQAWRKEAQCNGSSQPEEPEVPAVAAAVDAPDMVPTEVPLDADQRRNDGKTDNANGHAASERVAADASCGMRIALWSDGVLQLERGADDQMLLSSDEIGQLLRYLESVGLVAVRCQGGTA